MAGPRTLTIGHGKTLKSFKQRSAKVKFAFYIVHSSY